jgi:uncharacterized membrane protein
MLWSRLERARLDIGDLTERLRALEAVAPRARDERRVARAPGPAPSPSAAVVVPDAPRAPLPAVPLDAVAPPAPATPPRVAPRAPELPRPAPVDPEPGATHAPERAHHDPLGAAFSRARDWLLGGNTVVRVGVIVLLFGVAFFLNFAIEQGWLPVEFRLALAALGGLALTATGWRLRERRRDYALVLQGGGIGVVYLTVYAAVDLYGILAPGPGLALMVVLVILSSALAILQDAQSLAVLATAAGLLAPVIVSREGSHVALFSYYTALNLGIVAIARYKSWRPLNLLGFVFTFIVGAAWGSEYYEPAYFATTEPFLVVFFLLYVAVPVLFATRQASTEDRYMDGSLLFGVPLVAFGLQAGLVREFEYGLAFSALGAGLFYVGLASVLWHRVPEAARLLTETFLALGVGFGTLTIPLAVDARWTGSAWALEGAGLFWIGVRQRRRLAAAAGLLLQLLAGVSFLSAASLPTSGTPVLNSVYFGALLVSLSGSFCGWYAHRHRTEILPAFSGVPDVMLVWSLLWWTGAGLNEIQLHVPRPDRLAASLGFVSLTAVSLVWLSWRLAWANLAWPAVLLLPAMAVAGAAGFIDGQPHPLVRWGGLAWGVALASHYWIQKQVESMWPNGIPARWHAGMMWLVLFLASWETAWAVNRTVGMASVWGHVAWILCPGIALVLVPRLARLSAWPFARFGDTYVEALTPIAALLSIWILLASASRGAPDPLPYVPLVNPLELAQCLALVILLGLPSGALAGLSVRDRWLGAAVLAFAILNGLIARATHFFGGVLFDFDALWASARYQSALSIVWTAAAMTAMIGARVLAERAIWIAGATLLLAVVGKLFVVDLAGVGTVARIVSFVVVGLLILLVGYLSPLPPRAQEEARS